MQMMYLHISARRGGEHLDTHQESGQLLIPNVACRVISA